MVLVPSSEDKENQSSMRKNGNSQVIPPIESSPAAPGKSISLEPRRLEGTPLKHIRLEDPTRVEEHMEDHRSCPTTSQNNSDWWRIYYVFIPTFLVPHRKCQHLTPVPFFSPSVNHCTSARPSSIGRHESIA